MKRILFLVRSTSPYKTQRRDFDFIISNLIAKGYSIDIYDPKQKLLMQVNDKITVDYNVFPKWLYFSKMYLLLNFLILWRFLLKNKNNYDIVQVNYVREEYLLLPFLVNNVGGKLSLTLFGSDINQRNFIKKRFTKIYQLADSIIVTNPSFGETANNYVGNNIVSSKLKVLMLPQDHFMYYKHFDYSQKSEAKLKLNYPLDKTLVIMGTNSTENEQHEKIIFEIKKIKNPNDYFFVFPLANRFNKINEREKKIQVLIDQELKDYNIDVILKFISYEDMADLRLASDVFVNLRISDQFAASMLESNLAYCQVITGKWLPYNDYMSKVRIKSINNFEELNEAIEEVVNANRKTLVENLEFNKQAVLKHYDSTVLNSWMEYYDKLQISQE